MPEELCRHELVAAWCADCAPRPEPGAPAHRPAQRRPRARSLAARFPHFWHLAEGDAWEGIQRHGLLSAEGLVHLFDVPAAQAELLLSRRRPASVRLDHPQHGSAVLRDQKPISEPALERCLTGGMRSADWLAVLNAQVYFFPVPAELTSTFAAYAHRPALVLRVSTASLVAAHAASIRLCRINSGYFQRRPAPRGPDTFRPLGGVDAPLGPVKEVTVVGGVPDIVQHLESVTRFLPDGQQERVWP